MAVSTFWASRRGPWSSEAAPGEGQDSEIQSNVSLVTELASQGKEYTETRETGY